MPLFIECVQNDNTLGEICNTLRGVSAPFFAKKGAIGEIYFANSFRTLAM